MDDMVLDRDDGDWGFKRKGQCDYCGYKRPTLVFLGDFQSIEVCAGCLIEATDMFWEEVEGGK